jgi:hypothetical protein
MVYLILRQATLSRSAPATSIYLFPSSDQPKFTSPRSTSSVTIALNTSMTNLSNVPIAVRDPAVVATSASTTILITGIQPHLPTNPSFPLHFPTFRCQEHLKCHYSSLHIPTNLSSAPSTVRNSAAVTTSTSTTVLVMSI